MKASIITTGVYALIIASGDAAASSDWDDFFSQVTKQCIAASTIEKPRPSVIIDVGTDDEQVAMLVMDRVRGSNRAEVCVYNKRSKRAAVGAADLWNAPFQSNAR